MQWPPRARSSRGTASDRVVFVLSHHYLQLTGKNVRRFPSCCGKRMIYQASAHRWRCAGCGYVLVNWKRRT